MELLYLSMGSRKTPQKKNVLKKHVKHISGSGLRVTVKDKRGMKSEKRDLLTG